MKKRPLQMNQKTILTFFSKNCAVQDKCKVVASNTNLIKHDSVGNNSEATPANVLLENNEKAHNESILLLNSEDKHAKNKSIDFSDGSHSPKKTVQRSILTFTSPSKNQELFQWKNNFSCDKKGFNLIEEKKTSISLKRNPKKRKIKESPTKQAGLKFILTPEKTESTLTTDLSEIQICHSKQNEEILNIDEADFVNLAEDSIIISPKKINIKKRKCLLEETSSKRTLDFRELSNGGNYNKIFEDDMSFIFKESPFDAEFKKLDLKELKRCEVVKISCVDNEEKQLILRNISDNSTGVCIVRSPWNDSSIYPKDIVSVKGTLHSEGWVVDWRGLLVTNPDKLISGTTIVGSVYCMRKTVLSHIFKEVKSGSRYAMVLGNCVHQLFQEALKQKYLSIAEIEKDYKRIISSNDFVLNMYLEKINYDEITNQLHTFVESIHSFMQKYVSGYLNTKNGNEWCGEIVETQDIEENIWSPILGVKGKVDATVRVQVKNRVKTMPLELKTGKVSFSIEHRGQVILYCMLLKQLGYLVDSGLLLYLSSGVEMKEIKCEEKEMRDLTLLRNGLCHWLIKSTSIESSDNIAFPVLPPPLNRKSCSSCPYLVPCYAALREKNLTELKEDHLLRNFGAEATKHLSEDYIKFVFHWLCLIFLEKGSSKSSLSDIWTADSDIREKSGKCLAQMKVDSSVKDQDSRFITTFSKADGSLLETELAVGQLIIVSTENHIAHALGIIQDLSPVTISVMLDKHFQTEKLVSIDVYDSDGTFTTLMNNLTILLEDTAQSSVLRELIIDMKIPKFSPKLSSKIKRIGEDIFARLNREQVRAVLQAISAENYILIKGMPGAGKTTTMAALIELLCRMGLRVLVTSYTHSAVDNILINLVGKVKMLRLGPEYRIHPKLKEFTENHYLQSLKEVNAENIEDMFATKEVIGVTCFGCKHLWVERQIFDVCLVDEAAQVSLPAILKPISLAKKFILVGDPKQLPALVLNDKARESGLGTSLFERLDRPAVTSPLTLQYRMNRVINDLANNLTYDGLLQCGNKVTEEITLSLPQGVPRSSPDWLKLALSTELERSVVMLNIENTKVSDSIENPEEAKIVSQIVEALMKGGVEGDSIGIIAPYNRQVLLLRSSIEKCIEVNTVDQYQGRDKDVIIFSTTRSKPSLGKDILGDWNRLNVATTRAKRKLIITGNLSVLRKYDSFSKLISSVDQSNVCSVLSTF